MTFEKALDKLPDVCGFDPFSHFTLEDLCWLCLHELDLHAEGEYWHPVVVRRKLLFFCKKYGFYVPEAVAAFTAGQGLKKADAFISG